MHGNPKEPLRGKNVNDKRLLTNKQTKGEKRDFGAGDESRTRDLNLGKVALYQLSYSRTRVLWRREAESNRRKRICNPVHGRFAIAPSVRTHTFNSNVWSGRRVSNSRPQPWQGCALPTELLPQRESAFYTVAPYCQVAFLAFGAMFRAALRLPCQY